MRIEVSNGELIDKWTILTIKKERITGEEALKNVSKEQKLLTEAVQLLNLHLLPNVEELANKLLDVNFTLWDVEDRLREMDSNEEFGKTFIDLARSVYILNDQRASIKKRINKMTDSLLTEEKSHATYEAIEVNMSKEK